MYVCMYFWPSWVLVIALRFLSSCGSWGLAASCHVGSCFLIRDQTHVHCIERQILTHWSTRDIP